MEFKGTKGKWFNSGLEVISMPAQIKTAKADGANYKEAKANAKIISKAPELLEMLIKCTDMLATTTECEVLLKYQNLVDDANKLITDATTLK